MRRALALAAAVVSARQDHSCAEDVCFYHIPKTGGDSFKYLLRDELKRRGRSFWSNEWCPTRSNGTSTMVFREPRSHVVSQYFECRDSEWALGNRDKWATSHGAFPRNSTKRDPYAGFKQWIRHFANNGDDDFGCYDPRDIYYGSTATASSTPSTILERSRTRSRRCLWGRSGWRTTSRRFIKCEVPPPSFAYRCWQVGTTPKNPWRARATARIAATSTPSPRRIDRRRQI